MENLKDLVRAMYTDALTVNTKSDPSAVLGRLLADDFQSLGSSAEGKSKQQLIGQIQFFWKLVPDLRWEPQEILQDGNKVVVRSVATGAPNGDFFGMPTNGSKRFQIITIDVHTVERGQIQRVHHVEDWAAAMQQLKS